MVGMDEIKKIAELCKIDFDDLKEFSKDFGDIVNHVKVIAKVQPSGEQPSDFALGYADLRDDKLESSLSRKDALANAQSEDSDVYFSVPKTVKR